MGDAAKLAGVSQQTVSRVINAREYVGGHTRERVLSAMRELDYRPNPAAGVGDRSVEDARGHQRRLGRVRAGSVLRGLERAAHAHGYFVSVAPARLA